MSKALPKLVTALLDKLPPLVRAKICVMEDGCWYWLGYIDGGGYGQSTQDHRTIIAHRHLYTLLIGPIPTGLHLDHLCRVRHCVNPEHLEPVTPKVNINRGLTGSNHRNKTHCDAGHLFDEANTYHKKWPDGRPKGRDCRTCHREQEARRREKQREQA